MHAEVGRHRADRQHVEVDEIGLLGAHEVLAGDVATTDHRHRAVGQQQLVVHAPADTPEIAGRGDEAHHRALARSRERIEQPHLDPGLVRKAEQQFVLARGIHVVEQQAHAHATRGGISQFAQQRLTGGAFCRM